MARKDVAFKIRVEEELRRSFVDVCRREDRPAAQVIREFMRDYVQQKRREMQPSLFDQNDNAGY
jgi:hypothetical protein